MQMFRSPRAEKHKWHLYEDCRAARNVNRERAERRDGALEQMLKSEVCTSCLNRLHEDQAKEKRKHLKSY